MAIKNQNFEMYQKENKRLIISIVDQNGNNKDLTNGSAIFLVIVSGTKKILKTTENGGIIIDTYKLNILLNSSDTEDIIGDFDYQVQATDSLENSEIVTIGQIKINKSYI